MSKTKEEIFNDNTSWHDENENRMMFLDEFEIAAQEWADQENAETKRHLTNAQEFIKVIATHNRKNSELKAENQELREALRYISLADNKGKQVMSSLKGEVGHLNEILRRVVKKAKRALTQNK